MAKSNFPEILNCEATLLLHFRWPFHLNECNNGYQCETQSPPRAVILCSAILPPCCSSPHYIPFRHSGSCVPAMQPHHTADHPESPLPGDTHISKLLTASSHSSAPTLQFSLAILALQEPRDTAVQHWGVCRAREQQENSMDWKSLNQNGLKNQFCVLKQHFWLWNCSRSQYFFSSWIHSKANSLFIHEWCLERR